MVSKTLRSRILCFTQAKGKNYLKYNNNNNNNNNKSVSLKF